MEYDAAAVPAIARIFVNGRLRSERKLPADFKPDLSISGAFTVGNAWHNYCGHVQEAALFKEALPAATVRRLYDRGASRLGATLSPEDLRADQIASFEQALVTAAQPGASSNPGCMATLKSLCSTSRGRHFPEPANKTQGFSTGLFCQRSHHTATAPAGSLASVC